MVPGEKVLKGGRQGGIFVFLGVLGRSQIEINMKMQDEIGRISISGALDKCKLIS